MGLGKFESIHEFERFLFLKNKIKNYFYNIVFTNMCLNHETLTHNI